MTWCNLGLALDDLKGDYKGAEAAYRKHIAEDPNEAGAHSNLGNLLQNQLQDYDGAKASYGLAIKADPNYANAHHNYSILLAKHLNDPDLAVTHNKRAAALGHADAQKNVGWFAKKACSHPLTKFTTLDVGYYCDGCAAGMEQGSVMFGCRACDFDLCTACHQ